MAGTIESRVNNAATGGGASVPTAGAVTSNGSSLSSVAAGTAGNVLTDNGSAWVSSAPTGGASVLNPTSSLIQFFDDFNYTVASTTGITPLGPFNLISSGTNWALGSVASGETNRSGIVNISCSAVAAETSLHTDLNAFLLGGGILTGACSIFFNSICTVTNNFDFVFGYSNTWPSLGDGPVIAMSLGVSPTFFSCLCYSGGTPTVVVTTVPYAINTWYNLKIVINAAASLVTFFINGVSVGTSSTNITPNKTGIGMRTNQNAGTGPFTTRIDWLYQSFQPTSARGTF
jgi:hypothetical protein